MKTSSAGTRCRRTSPAARTKTGAPNTPADPAEDHTPRSPLGARLSRRSTLAATALGLLGPLLGDETQAEVAAASAPDPLPIVPPGGIVELPLCASVDQHYCVEFATLGGLPAEFDAAFHSSSPDHVADAFGIRMPGGTAPDGIDKLGKDVDVRVHLGRFEPAVTIGYAAGFDMTVSGNANTGFIVDLRGQMASVPHTDVVPGSCAACGVACGGGAGPWLRPPRRRRQRAAHRTVVRRPMRRAGGGECRLVPVSAQGDRDGPTPTSCPFPTRPIRRCRPISCR
jgi:hypothetical protein